MAKENLPQWVTRIYWCEKRYPWFLTGYSGNSIPKPSFMKLVMNGKSRTSVFCVFSSYFVEILTGKTEVVITNELTYWLVITNVQRHRRAVTYILQPRFQQYLLVFAIILVHLTHASKLGWLWKFLKGGKEVYKNVSLY